MKYALKGNFSSAGVIEANGGEFLEEVNGSKHYKITIKEKLPSIKLNNFSLEPYEQTNPFHHNLKNDIISMEDSYQISKDINTYLKRNKEHGEIDNITCTYTVICNGDYIGLAFVNYHPEEKEYSEEIEIGVGILPSFRGKGLGSLLVKELSDKLLEVYPRFDYITSRTSDDNTSSIKMARNAGFKHIKDDEYRYRKK